MRDRQHAACKALATADVGAVEVLGAGSDSTAPSFNTAQHKEKAMTAKSENGLNAVGKPYGENFDPHYKNRASKTSLGRLYAPYGQDMRFVGDPPRSEQERRRKRRFSHRQKLSPAPLFGLPEPDDTLDMMAAAKFLSGIEKMINTLRRAMLKAVEVRADRDVTSARAQKADIGTCEHDPPGSRAGCAFFVAAAQMMLARIICAAATKKAPASMRCCSFHPRTRCSRAAKIMAAQRPR